MAALFEASRYNNARSRDLLKEFEYFNQDRFYGGLLVASGRAESAADFFERAHDPQIVPKAEDIRRLRKIYAAFAPIYDELVWRPSLSRVRAKRAALVALAAKTSLSSLYARAAAFYRSSDDGPVIVVLVPIPAQNRDFQMPVVAGVVSFEYPLPPGLDQNELENNLSVLFHELCHLLSHRMPKDLAAKLKASLRGRPGSDRILEEGLATAIGVWEYRKATGKEKGKEEEWYADAEIGAFAQAIYPKLAAYLDSARPMDDEFIAFVGAQYARVSRAR
ncbi:MAG: hypothetical protein ACHQ49_18085 [Elusimicrobiota bacterium]